MRDQLVVLKVDLESNKLHAGWEKGQIDGSVLVFKVQSRNEWEIIMTRWYLRILRIWSA